MAPTSRVAVSLDLGPRSPVEVVTAALSDINSVCQFGGQLQDRATRNEALRHVLRRPGQWLEDALDFPEPYTRRSYSAFLLGAERFASPSLEAAIADYIRTNDLDTGEVYVERLTYENPVEVVLAVGAVVLAVLRLVRDWPERRRINRARADDYQNQVATRQQVRRIVERRIASGQYPLTPDQIDDLLTKDVSDAFRALGNSHLNLRELGEGDS
jgi:hypothetical protein